MKSSYILVFLTCTFGLVQIVKSGGGDFTHDCSLPFDNGYGCSGDMSSVEPQTAYFFVIEESMCFEFTYYGCGGNTNRFTNSTICESYCLLQGDAKPFTTGAPSV